MRAPKVGPELKRNARKRAKPCEGNVLSRELH